MATRNVEQGELGLLTATAEPTTSPLLRPLALAPRLQDLEPVSSLVPVFNAIRGYIAANAHGMTRDEAILDELTKLLHAKIFDEATVKPGAALRFYAASDEPPSKIKARITNLYSESMAELGNGGNEERRLLLDDNSCAFAVQALHHRRLTGAERDVIGEAYEALIFPALRGGQGQFFTPRNVGDCLAALLEPAASSRVVDPACGTGGFLGSVVQLLSGGSTKKLKVPRYLAGADKDDLLVRLASDSLRLRGIENSIVCTNSLAPLADRSSFARTVLTRESYDVVITNPPFGAKIPVTGPALLEQYDLARAWAYDRTSERWVKQGTLKDGVPPQILFIELCWQLLKEGGRCGIVLPEGILGNQSAGYVRQWLVERADILAVVDCPLETFLPSTSTKTVLLVFQRRKTPQRPPVFMAVAERCGHDRRGNMLIRPNGEPDDDFPLIAAEWKRVRMSRP